MSSRIGGAIIIVFAFFAAVAATTRLLTVKGMPDYIKNASNAVTNLFNGAFGI